MYHFHVSLHMRERRKTRKEEEGQGGLSMCVVSLFFQQKIVHKPVLIMMILAYTYMMMW